MLNFNLSRSSFTTSEFIDHSYNHSLGFCLILQLEVITVALVGEIMLAQFFVFLVCALGLGLVIGLCLNHSHFFFSRSICSVEAGYGELSFLPCGVT